MAYQRVVILLAAGEGRRMRSNIPKVLQKILGRTLVEHVLLATEELNARDTLVVVGSGSESVQEVLSQLEKKLSSIRSVLQEDPGGTAHAVRLALTEIDIDDEGTIIVLSGDAPLITAKTLLALVEAREELPAGVAVLTAEVENPFGYGRVVRDEDDEVLKIVEDKDCSPPEEEITEINSGIYAFRAGSLRSALSKVKRNNSQNEEYLTDTIEIIRESGDRVIPLMAEDYFEILGVNDQVQLAQARAAMRDRVNLMVMNQGVTLIDPPSTFIDVTVEIEAGVLIKPGCQLEGKSKISQGARIGPDVHLLDCLVDSGAIIIKSECAGAIVGPEAEVGPYSFLRPGAVLGAGSKVGAFVEIKNSTIGEGSKVPHLAYIGDAIIGRESNIGAGTITANYDGELKHQTIIGDHVRVGSNNVLIAPLEIGDGAYTAAGSAITENVPPGAMGVGRGRQRNILGWVLQKRPGSDSARAADRAGKNQQAQ